MQRAVASCSYSRATAAPVATSASRAARSPLRAMLHASTAATTSQAPLQRCSRQHQRSLLPLLRASASAPTAEKEPPRNKTVADIMTRGVFTVTADTTVDEGAILCWVSLEGRCQRTTTVFVVSGAPRFSHLDLDLFCLSLRSTKKQRSTSSSASASRAFPSLTAKASW